MQNDFQLALWHRFNLRGEWMLEQVFILLMLSGLYLLVLPYMTKRRSGVPAE